MRHPADDVNFSTRCTYPVRARIEVVAIGIFSTAIRPAGYLTVTYRKQAPELPADGGKVCRRCAETVKPAALVCRYCGYEFEVSA